jgi:ABC-type nitrate/sulfonate/bicarbonate transport system ATPase subunit
MQTRLEAPVSEPLSFDNAAVAAEDVVRRYPGGRRRPGVLALDGVSLRVREGEVVAIVGPSGCGKSTLLEVVAGLQEPDGGRVAATGALDAPGRLEACAFMPQRDLLLPWRDALGNAALALECAGTGRGRARADAAPLFERFGLAEFERSYPGELSGGMRQRVAFLRTLLAGRPVLLLDEPFAALDSITRGSMQSWLAGALQSEPRTVLLVTHDVEEALFLADRVAVMSPRPGRIVAELDVPFPRPRPRRETVTDPAFARLRERAMEALGQ